MGEQIYVAVYQSHLKFTDLAYHMQNSYVGTLSSILTAIENDGDFIGSYDLYELGSDKLKIKTTYSVEKAV